MFTSGIPKMFLSLSVSRDIIDTIGVSEGAQKIVRCNDKILVVAGIWAGYDTEARTDLLSFSCSDWDEPTSYFTVNNSYNLYCSSTTSQVMALSPQI